LTEKTAEHFIAAEPKLIPRLTLRAVHRKSTNLSTSFVDIGLSDGSRLAAKVAAQGWFG